MTLAFMSGVLGFFLSLTLFLQVGLGFNPLETALTTFPSSIGLILASLLSPKLAPSPGRPILAAGVLCMAAAMSALAFTINHYGAALTAWNIRPVIIFFGFGMGLILPSLTNVVISGVHERNAGAASGLISTAGQVGNAIGVALIGVVLFGVLSSHAQTSAEAASAQLSTRLTAIGVPTDVRARTIADFQTCFVAQTHQEDPAGIPPSCRAATGHLPAGLAKKLGHILPGAYEASRKDNFLASIQVALYYEGAVFIATFGLIFLLPRAGLAAWDARTTAEKLIASHLHTAEVSNWDMEVIKVKYVQESNAFGGQVVYLVTADRTASASPSGGVLSPL